MRKIFVLISLLCSALLLNACRNYEAGMEIRRIGDYAGPQVKKLDVKGFFKLKVFCNAKENRCSVKGKEEEALPDYIKIFYGETLKLEMLSTEDPKNAMNKPSLPVVVELYTTGDIREVELALISKGIINNLNAKNFEGEVSDVSVLDLNNSNLGNAEFSLEKGAKLFVSGNIKKCELEAEESSESNFEGIFERFNVSAEGNSRIVIRGKVDRLNANLEDTSVLNGLEVEQAKVDLEDSSSLRIDKLNKRINGSAEQNAKILYGGPGTVAVKTSGQALIKRIDD